MGIFNSNGIWTEDSKGIEGTISSYFVDIFSSSHPSSSDIHTVTSCLTPTITMEMNERLVENFTREEIRAAFFNISPLKAPGNDGLPGLFFANY